MRIIRPRQLGDEGFTLVELMVVILIIAILMTITVPSFYFVRNRGYASQAKATRSAAVKTMEIYGIENNEDFSLATAAKLNIIEKSIPFVDGAPPAGDYDSAGLTVLGPDLYTITVNGHDGNTYTALKAVGVNVVNKTNGVNE